MTPDQSIVGEISPWVALVAALLTGPIGLAVAALIRSFARSASDNNAGQNQALKGLRADMDQLLAKNGLQSVAPKPPPPPPPQRSKRRTGGVRFPTPLPFFPPEIDTKGDKP